MFRREVTNFILMKCHQDTGRRNPVYVENRKIPAEIRFDETPTFKVLRNRGNSKFVRKIENMLCKILHRCLELYHRY